MTPVPEPVPTVPGAHRKPPQMGVRAKVAIGALAGFFGLTVATVAGALPAPLQEGLETFVELVTPVEIDHDVPEQDPLQEEPSGQFMGDVRINESDKIPPDLVDPATPTPDITPGDEPLTSVPPDQVGPVASADPLDTTDAGGASGTEGELDVASGDPTTDPTSSASNRTLPGCPAAVRLVWTAVARLVWTAVARPVSRTGCAPGIRGSANRRVTGGF